MEQPSPMVSSIHFLDGPYISWLLSCCLVLACYLIALSRPRLTASQFQENRRHQTLLFLLAQWSRPKAQNYEIFYAVRHCAGGDPFGRGGGKRLVLSWRGA